jgi:predicted Zn-dependent protease
MSDSTGAGLTLAALEREAHALVDRRRYQQAQRTISVGLQEFPDSIELQYLGAFVDYASQRPEPALRAVNALLSQAPHHYGARKLRAHLLEEAGQLAEAEQVWIELLRERPQNADCFAGYGELMLKTLNIDKAERLAREGLRQAPDHPGCLYLAALIDLIRNRRGGDSEHLRRMLREHPEHSRSAVALVIALSGRGNDRGALRIAQELLRNQPDSAQRLNLVRELKARAHWSMLPLYPMRRWGWTAAIVISLMGIIGLRASQQVLPPQLYSALTTLWLAYVIYSWVWPRVLRKLV